MTYATAADVAAELGLPAFTDPQKIAQIDGWLVRVEATIRARIADLDAQVASGRINAALLANIEAAAVARKYTNPEGLKSERIDDYQYGRVDDASTVDVALTDGEWALLMPPAARGAFTVRPRWG